MAANYLNNKDMLKEIHKSKISYCDYDDEIYTTFDIILDDKDDILLETNITTAKEKRADRIASNNYQEAIKEYDGPVSKKPKQSEFKIDIENIPTEDLVFRVHTYEHIPLEEGRKKNPKKEADFRVKLNFKPFKHYIIEDGKPKEVLKSHYKNGEFSLSHGSMTDKLATMFMLLVERYSQRSNWRGYCVDEETEALTQRGWLSYDKINENDIILSYDNGKMKWSKIKSIFRDEFDGLMYKLDSRGMDALITPGHKLVTDGGMTRVEYLLETDRVILMGDSLKTDFEPTYCNSLVELVGWIITEGNFEPKKRLVSIWQNEGECANRIRKCLNELGYKFIESLDEKGNIRFIINAVNSVELFELLPNKNLTMDFIVKLTESQRNLLIETMVDGNGLRQDSDKKHNNYCQKDSHHVDLYQALCAVSGKNTNSILRDTISSGKPTQYYTIHTFSKKVARGKNINFHGGKNNGKHCIGKGKVNHPNKPTHYYKGMVWCPETEYGCFVARRNGKVYLTGNTYVDEMMGQALLHLSQVGLQFDESRSENPFAYFTQVLTRSFTRVLNSEKRHQDIRDDLLIQNGQNPSYTRQMEYENQLHKMLEDLNNNNQ